MAVTSTQMASLIRTLLSGEAGGKTLQDYLASIPRLESLADVPSGTPVLVRGDVDAKPGPKVGDGDIRLQSMVETLKYGQQRGWKQVIFGHIGRKPEGSLKSVAKRIGELLGTDVPLIEDWYDDATGVQASVTEKIKQAPAGSVLVLENTRRWKIERVLWDASAADADKVAEPLVAFANQMADKVASVYVNEALSAGSLDSSTVVVPSAMKRVALGKYVAREFDGPMLRCQAATLVVFSGLKIDKLDDLSAMIARGTIRWVFTAGSLAMALRKADARLKGQNLCIGLAEAAGHEDKPYFIEESRVKQAEKMLTDGRAKGIRFVLPVDSILQDGRASDTIGPADQQFDIGPKSSIVFAEAVGEFIKTEAAGGRKPVAFHNGVFGMFEDPRFENGTKNFIAQLKRMKDAGVEVYVGGGEGGAALDKYGQHDWVTHCFTAGGTVLNALGSSPVPYLVALSAAAKR
ncbi:MAG: phosphoglycerate kinase [Planctomycetes bacterium]|nr:phosphoglycerate kinase [Planctomycetota bacterium]